MSIEPSIQLRRPRLWLVLAFLVPNLVTLAGGFVYDDVPLLVENEALHSLEGVDDVWIEPFWPDRPLLTLYRPVTKTFWVLLWSIGGGAPVAFHLFNLLIGTIVVLLVHEYLLELELAPLTSFLAAYLFALFPIHVEAVAPAFGASELLAACFGVGALLLHRRDHRILALVSFALAVYSKESAAALAAIAFLVAPAPRKRFIPDAVAAIAVIVSILIVRSMISNGMDAIPAADNPTSLQSPFWRTISALWIQVLYLWKTFVPVYLSVEYSYNQIPLITRLGDPRALAGIAFITTSAWAVFSRRRYAIGVVAWWILFLPTANLLYPIGTIMAERLAFLPSAGAALVAAMWLSGRKTLRHRRVLLVLLAVVFIVYGGRTIHRNLAWIDTDRFYQTLVADAPDSVRAHYGRGVYLASEGRDAEAIVEYQRATEILPSFADAHFNRANALVRLGRTQEAIDAYQVVVRLAPGQTTAERNLMTLLSGGELRTQAREVE